MILSSIILGQGPIMIILHGLFGEGKNWLSIAKLISNSYAVHLLDQRNHGESFHSRQQNYQLMASDLDKYVKSKNISKFSLLGHSMGGKVAMEFALLYPKNLDKLIIVDIAPKLYKENYEHIFKGLKHVLLKAESRKQAQAILMDYTHDIILTNFLLKSLFFSATKPKLKFNSSGIEDNIQNMLMPPEKKNSFYGSTYFICGEKSNYVTKKDIPYITELFPNNNMITILNAGHWPHFEQQQKFLDCIQQILVD